MLLDGRPAQTGKARVVGLGVVDPAVESNLTDGGARIRIEIREKVFLPRGRAVAGIPRMQAVAGQYHRLCHGERGDVGPVGFAGTVGHGALHADGREIREHARIVRHELGVLEVAVGVVEIHFFNREWTRINANVSDVLIPQREVKNPLWIKVGKPRSGDSI